MEDWGKAEGILRSLLQDLFEADCRGARRDRLARAHGYADGYMRALIDVGLVTDQQLLRVVTDERLKAARRPQPRVQSERRTVRVSPAPVPAVECTANA